MLNIRVQKLKNQISNFGCLLIALCNLNESDALCTERYKFKHSHPATSYTPLYVCTYIPLIRSKNEHLPYVYTIPPKAAINESYETKIRNRANNHVLH